MKETDWAITLRNVLQTLKPGGAIQWCENDTSVAARYTLRGGPPVESPVTPLHPQICPTYPTAFRRSWNTLLGSIPGRAEAMVYGFNNLPKLFTEPEIGNLVNVLIDAYSTDAIPELREEYSLMCIEATITLMEGAFGSHAEKVDLGAWREEMIEEAKNGNYVRMTCCNFVGWKRS